MDNPEIIIEDFEFYEYDEIKVNELVEEISKKSNFIFSLSIQIYLFKLQQTLSKFHIHIIILIQHSTF